MINRVIEAQKEIDRVNKKLNDGIEKLLPSEVELVCSYQMVMEKSLESLPEICKDFKFKSTYLIYSQDLTFQSEYYKPNYGANTRDKLAFFNELKENNDEVDKEEKFDDQKYSSFRKKAQELGFERKVEQSEITRDIAYMNLVADEWQKTIDNVSHPDQKLKVISEETRATIREIKKQAKKNNISDQIRDSDIKVELWKSKYLHYRGAEFTEQIERDYSLPYELTLNGKTVYFTYRSLIHILSRHFAQLVSNSHFKSTKSYHSPIFQPERIHLILENIFARLSNSEHFKNEVIEHNVAYNFRFKETDFQFYLKEFGNNKEKLMISSVYPIEDLSEKEKLKGFELKDIDSQLKVYKKL